MKRMSIGVLSQTERLKDIECMARYIIELDITILIDSFEVEAFLSPTSLLSRSGPRVVPITIRVFQMPSDDDVISWQVNTAGDDILCYRGNAVYHGLLHVWRLCAKRTADTVLLHSLSHTRKVPNWPLSKRGQLMLIRKQRTVHMLIDPEKAGSQGRWKTFRSGYHNPERSLCDEKLLRGAMQEADHSFLPMIPSVDGETVRLQALHFLSACKIFRGSPTAGQAR